MNKRQRQGMANRLLMVAVANGASVTTEERKEYREIRIEAKFPEVSASMVISDRFGPGVVAHWYDAKRDLAQGPFSSINTFHKRKAMLYRNDNARFELAFEQACQAVANGSAFAPS